LSSASAAHSRITGQRRQITAAFRWAAPPRARRSCADLVVLKRRIPFRGQDRHMPEQ
jgi:hypothetical protein